MAPRIGWSGVAALLVVVPGCGKQAAPSGPPAAERAHEPARAAEPPAASYSARLDVGPCPPKSTCQGTVLLEAKGDYHINAEYPYKFKPDDPPAGVTWTRPVFTREGGKFDEKHAALPVSFTTTDEGEIKVRGLFSLSVCSAAACLMDRQNLEATVKVH